MLPQTVEVVKHIHHISEIRALGVAVDEEVGVLTAKFAGVSSDLLRVLQ
jgi:hypothetical protein